MWAAIPNGSGSLGKDAHSSADGVADDDAKELVMTDSSSRSDDHSSPAATLPSPRNIKQRSIFSCSRPFFLMLLLALTMLHTGQTLHNVRSLSASLPFGASYSYMTSPLNNLTDNSKRTSVATGVQEQQQPQDEEETDTAGRTTNNNPSGVAESNASANSTITTRSETITRAINRTEKQLENPQQWEPALRMPPLPSPLVRNATGGLVFFLHIPKTGGTTMRVFFNQHADQFHIARNVGGWNNMVSMVDLLVKEGTKGQIVAMETHDQNVPPYHKLSPKIRQWKRTAEQNHVPFFVATVLREPVSMQISSFNYYYVAPWKKLANDTVPDFLDTLLYNPQCSFLHQGGMFFDNLDRKHPLIRERRDKLNRELQKSQCDHDYQLLLEDMDWVGTTQRMSGEMMPLFHYLFQLPNVTGKHTNKMRVRMHKDRLNGTDLAFVENSTLWDQEWYRKAQEIYQFDQWSDQIGPEFFSSERRRLR